MSLSTYYKRYRMEAPLKGLPRVPELPRGFGWVGWEDDWLETHAEVKYRAFRDEVDACVFPNLSHAEGCLHLMQVIRHKDDFCPEATWLVTGPAGPCGTIQGLRGDEAGLGSVQNLGVVPECRGLGLGGALLLKALHGFRSAGLVRAMLEVTAKNVSAVRLYHRLGFNTVKTLYREVTAPEPVESLFVI